MNRRRPVRLRQDGPRRGGAGECVDRASTERPALPGPRLTFGRWQVDPSADEIRDEGRVIKLEPQNMRLLLALAERPRRESPEEILNGPVPGECGFDRTKLEASLGSASGQGAGGAVYWRLAVAAQPPETDMPAREDRPALAVADRRAGTGPSPTGRACALACVAAAAAWTVAGRYATAAQARQLLAARADAMLVSVRCCGVEAADEAVGIASGMQASGVPDDTPVLVSGEDLLPAAAVANRLIIGGMTRVWLVTP